jgi:tetratricopeptide (TPR) repeat protein
MSKHDDETAADIAPVPESEQPEERDRFKPLIALSLSALVLVGAGLAILQVQASSNESNTARETTRVAVEAMRANVVADTVAGLKPALDAERAFLPFRRPLVAGAPSLSQAAGLATSRAQTVGSLRIAQRAVPDLGAGRLLPGLQANAERLTLTQHALATTRITWNDRSTQYTTVIAVLAVAIFLVGFGLIVGGPIRGAAYVLGLAVGLFVVGWGAWIYSLSIPSTPPSAIRSTARGTVLTSGGNYRRAIAQYEAALRAAGDYATAYSDLARARLLAANPDYPVTRAVISLGGRALALAQADARKAQQLDRRDILATSLLALTQFYRGEYAQALASTDAAIAINPKVPDLWILKGAIEVARGNQPAASAAFAHGTGLLRTATPSQQTRLLASALLSYMTWLERYDPAHAAGARALANRAVSVETAFTLGRALPTNAPARGTVAVKGLRFARGKLRLRLRWVGLPAGTAMSVIGYERPLAAGAWTQPPGLALFATVAGSGGRGIALPLQRVCKPTRVRVDVYLNGKRALVATGPGVPETCDSTLHG